MIVVLLPATGPVEQPFLLLDGGAGPHPVTGSGELLATAHHVCVVVPVHSRFGTSEAKGLAELPRFPADWLAADPGQFGASLALFTRSGGPRRRRPLRPDPVRLSARRRRPRVSLRPEPVQQHAICERGDDMTAMISDCPSAAHPNGKQPARPGGQGASRQIRGIRPRRRPAQADHPATAAPTPLLDGLGPTRVWVAAAFLLGVIAREVLGGPEAAGRALQHALELAEPDQVPVPSLRHPPPGPRGRHHQHPSTDESRIGSAAGLPAGADRPATPPPAPARHLQALTHGETRVLRYLPTNLSAREIAEQLYLSVHTVKTHQRHLYQKLGARTRTQAVQQARALGLLAAYSRRR